MFCQIDRVDDGVVQFEQTNAEELFSNLFSRLKHGEQTTCRSLANRIVVDAQSLAVGRG